MAMIYKEQSLEWCICAAKSNMETNIFIINRALLFLPDRRHR